MCYYRLVAASIVPEQNPGDFNQAMMELGARICTPQNPNCMECPIQSDCKALKQLNKVKELSKNGFFDENKKKRNRELIEEHGKEDFIFLKGYQMTADTKKKKYRLYCVP